MIVIAVVVLIAFGPTEGETCDSSQCCCVDSATATQVGNTVAFEVAQSGANCPAATATLSCSVRSNAVCSQSSAAGVFDVFRSGKIAYVVRNRDDDTCSSRLSCDSGACASSSTYTVSDWAGKYSKTSSNLDPWPPSCDPTKCCCADSGTVSGVGTALTVSYKPNIDSAGCDNKMLVTTTCQQQGKLYLFCGSGNQGFVVKKYEGRTYYEYEVRQECNGQFECRSGGCTGSGNFTGQFESSGSVPGWSFAAALVFSIATLSYSY